MSTQDNSPHPDAPGAHFPEEAEYLQPEAAAHEASLDNFDDVNPDELMQAATARIAELEGELAEMRDRWMRSEAESQNIRNRAKRDVDETRQYAVQGFARDVAEAAENLRRGLDSLPAPSADESDLVGKLREGFEGVERSFLALLERNGIVRRDPTGALFDPNLHQAMGEQENAEHPPGTVIQAWTPSWTLHGRLLRPAMVVVAKAGAPATEAESATVDGRAATGKLDTTA